MQRPPFKLPKVLYDFKQFVTCGRVTEREGRAPMFPLTLPLLPELIGCSILATFFYFATGPF